MASTPGPRRTVRCDDEVLTRTIHVPKPPPGFGAGRTRGSRSATRNAIAVAAVAASLLLDGDGTVQEARVVLKRSGADAEAGPRGR